jgi:putative restriction endonuclease
MNPRTWSFLTIEGARQYGGNAGYLDDPANVYRYDSDVANHLQIRSDDVIILRSKTSVLGIAKIERIVEGEGNKERLRCPVCQATNIKERVAREPRWKCKRGHVFDEPARETVLVRTFDAHYENTFRATPPSLTTVLLHDAVLRPSDQMSIKEIDLAKIEAYLLQDPGCRTFIVEYAASIVEESSDESGGPNELPYSIIAARRRVIREVSVRRGQMQFRDRLIRRYGSACQVSRCAFPALVEAAHLLSYAKTSDNSVHNGLLLRSDLHTLFDLALLAVHPKSMKIALHPALFGAGYSSFDGLSLFINGTNGPDRAALTERWGLFLIRVEQKI